MSNVSLSDAQDKANKLGKAVENLEDANKYIDNAINKLKEGATTNKVRTQVTKLSEMKNDISNTITSLNNASSQIITIAQNLQEDE